MKKEKAKGIAGPEKAAPKRRGKKNSAVIESPRSHMRLHARFSVAYLADFAAKDGSGGLLAKGKGIVSNISLGGAQILQPEFEGGIAFPCHNFEINFQEGPLAGLKFIGELISARDFSGKCAFGVRFHDDKNKSCMDKLDLLIYELDASTGAVK